MRSRRRKSVFEARAIQQPANLGYAITLGASARGRLDQLTNLWAAQIDSYGER
jgi:hypothetical protein